MLCTCSAQTFYNDLSLSETIPKEWSWILEHNGAIKGQVLVSGNRSIYMISLKQCLDRGMTVGAPMSQLYEKVGNNSKAESFAGDFNTLVRSGDAYADCVLNPTQWYNFRVLNLTTNGTDELPRGTTQYVRRHIGGHFGIGIHIIPYNFSYDSKKLKHTFNEMLRRKMSPEKQITHSKQVSLCSRQTDSVLMLAL
eukprot:IDg1986t1